MQYNTITNQVILPGCESLKASLEQQARIDKIHASGGLLWEELSEEAQEHAIEEMQRMNWNDPDTGQFMQDEIDDYWIPLAEKFGLYIDDCRWTLDPNYRGIAFTGRFQYRKDWKAEFTKVYTMDKLAQDMETSIRNLCAPRLYQAEFSFSVRHGGGQNFRQGIDEMNDYRLRYSLDVDDRFESDAENVIDTFRHAVLDSLQKQADYQESEEYARECLVNGDYVFDINGNII